MNKEEILKLLEAGKIQWGVEEGSLYYSCYNKNKEEFRFIYLDIPTEDIENLELNAIADEILNDLMNLEEEDNHIYKEYETYLNSLLVDLYNEESEGETQETVISPQSILDNLCVEQEFFEESSPEIVFTYPHERHLQDIMRVRASKDGRSIEILVWENPNDCDYTRKITIPVEE